MRKVKAPRLVSVAIMTTITIIFWVFFEVYGVLTSSSPVEVPPEILEPISPTLNSDILSQIEQRTFFEESEIEELSFQPIPTPPETTTPTPTLEAQPELETIDEATESAEATPSAVEETP